ncbi:Uncharacterized protein PECH_001127 [Penicillium ucsense]|uniref:BZIP domain-containing protein n=1 Tax=Penicillium ucsense TaxID=2839758 RepID=A0A8J8VXN0_9EURO|nr:Uncharacterized protein PECM_000815 [Penicillium ucsense]KAF7733138.1 Uncharacterized protein PECH_001127 [Penicillium ucsense]
MNTSTLFNDTSGPSRSSRPSSATRSPDDPRRASRKRVVTAARREQNKLAQRAYRERQKLFRNSPSTRHGMSSRKIAPRLSPSHGLGYSLHNHNTDQVYNSDLSMQLVLPARHLADPLANTLQTTRDAFWSAILHNAQCLGFDLIKLAECGHTYTSPFYKPITPDDQPRDLVAPCLSTSTPISLRPTMAQILIPHHASLDLIPIPLLRERAIMLTFALPEVYNLLELKQDVYVRDGLACLRYSDEGACQPWDPQSWRVKPWFRSKWRMAVDD